LPTRRDRVTGAGAPLPDSRRVGHFEWRFRPVSRTRFREHVQAPNKNHSLLTDTDPMLRIALPISPALFGDRSLNKWAEPAGRIPRYLQEVSRQCFHHTIELQRELRRSMGALRASRRDPEGYGRSYEGTRAADIQCRVRFLPCPATGAPDQNRRIDPSASASVEGRLPHARRPCGADGRTTARSKSRDASKKVRLPSRKLDGSSPRNSSSQVSRPASIRLRRFPRP
jgi:hypothetical protein